MSASILDTSKLNADYTARHHHCYAIRALAVPHDYGAAFDLPARVGPERTAFTRQVSVGTTPYADHAAIIAMHCATSLGHLPVRFGYWKYMDIDLARKKGAAK